MSPWKNATIGGIDALDMNINPISNPGMIEIVFDLFYYEEKHKITNALKNKEEPDKDEGKRPSKCNKMGHKVSACQSKATMRKKKRGRVQLG